MTIAALDHSATQAFIPRWSVLTTGHGPNAAAAAHVGLEQEIAWRQAPGLFGDARPDRRFVMTRWLDHRATSRHEAVTPTGRHVLSISLKSTPIRFLRDGAVQFDGTMNAGALYVTGPGRKVAVECAGPCDFIHVYVSDGHLGRRQAEMGLAAERAPADLDGQLVRDAVVELLTRTLLDEHASSQPVYAEAVAEAVLTRLLLLVHGGGVSNGLPKWRLRRVEALIHDKLSTPIGLAEMAAAAGLSRMHFAAQFRAATGASPHEFLTRRRVEAAKQLLEQTSEPLAQVALSVGFQAQAHFTTVFRRLTGETPGRWRRGRCDGAVATAC